ncbi:MAG TPA: GDSL-type esterase/lipase family protein [Thermoanaerobaculia bacterium]|nr:GDSL-type esterase/lipase family protein [Thermoanaerobaculia bacterium]
MRSALLVQLLSGHLWFTAAILVVILIALDLGGALRDRPVARVAARLSFLLAIGLGALSGTPLPWWLLGPLLAALGGVILTGFRPARGRGAFLSGLAASILVLASVAVEIPWHRDPRPSSRPASVVVIGDSLSSGGFGESRPWPARLQDHAALPVRNLALPGETTGSALTYQMSEIEGSASGSLLLLQIGGNDLLGETGVDEFERSLDRLLEESKESGFSTILLFELPLPPGAWRWGAVQRRLARKHGIGVIPKHVLAGILANPSMVDDGLHLRDAGHEALAADLARILGWKG